MRTDRRLCFLVAAGLALAARSGFPDHFPNPALTPLWCQFYGSAQIAGTNVKVGDEIAAYDPNGVLCGKFVVTFAGFYGYMNVYGDDSTTPGVDEGATSGDTITFRIWDAGAGVEYAAEVLPSSPGTPVWQYQERKNVNLAAGVQYELGDVNQDGIVDVSDVVKCVALSIENGSYQGLADMNNDFRIDISDIILLMRKILGLD